MASSPSAAPFSAGGESIRKQVSPSRRRDDTSIQITHVPLSPSSTSDAANRLIFTGVAWKRRSGFGRLSDTVGVGKSWERRRFVLYAGGGGGPNAVARDGGTPRLVYYSLNDFQSQTTPRGTLDLLAERATIHATHFGNEVAGAQPTPYTLSIKTTDGIAPESTKWKLCFDDRYAQMAWLVALTDVVVEASVRQCNAATLAAEVQVDRGLLGLGVGGGEHGGFHRLYEEGVPAGGMLGVVRGALMDAGKSDDDDDDYENDEEDNVESERPKEEQIQKQTQTQRQKERRYAPIESFVEMEATAEAELKAAVTGTDLASDEPDSGAPLSFDSQSLLRALAVVNLSVLYAHFTAKSTSFLVISWWQVLLAVNVCLYKCLVDPTTKNIETNTLKQDKKLNEDDKENEEVQDETAPIEKNDTDASMEMTKSMIGAELLRGEDVPVSDVPVSDEPAFQLNGAAIHFDKTSSSPQWVEALTEEEMSAAHDHERWAVAAPDVDLSGSWTLIADDAFKAEYDQYLGNLGFNRITRGVACSLISRTLEETKQFEGGRKLFLKGTNPKGCWERVLVASGYPDFKTHSAKKEGQDYQHSKSFIKTADAEDVSAEAWWENRGTVHRSWLRGGTKYGGGDFESLRYLEENGSVLVCKSIFHPKDLSKSDAIVTWRFKRNESEEVQA